VKLKDADAGLIIVMSLKNHKADQLLSKIWRSKEFLHT